MLKDVDVDKRIMAGKWYCPSCWYKHRQVLEEHVYVEDRSMCQLQFHALNNSLLLHSHTYFIPIAVLYLSTAEDGRGCCRFGARSECCLTLLSISYCYTLVSHVGRVESRAAWIECYNGIVVFKMCVRWRKATKSCVMPYFEIHASQVSKQFHHTGVCSIY